MNENREDNIRFIRDYNLHEVAQSNMLNELVVEDFSKMEKDINNKKEMLYFFGKEYELNHKDRGMEKIEVYIKLVFKERKDGEFMLMISFHKAKREVDYYFK